MIRHLVKLFAILCITLLITAFCRAELPTQNQSFGQEIKELEQKRLAAFKAGNLELLYLLDGKISNRRYWQRAQKRKTPTKEWRTSFYADLIRENKEAKKYYKAQKNEEEKKRAEANIETIDQMGIPGLEERSIVRVSGDVDGSYDSGSSSRFSRRSRFSSGSRFGRSLSSRHRSHFGSQGRSIRFK